MLAGLQSGLRMDGLRRMLGRFGLSGHHHLQPIQKLSGEINAMLLLLQHLHLIGTVHIDITTLFILAPYIVHSRVRSARPAHRCCEAACMLVTQEQKDC